MRQGTCLRRSGVRGLLTALLVFACGQSGPASSESIDDGTGFTGDLEAYIATYEDGETRTFYGLRKLSGETIDLVFREEPAILPGSHVVVQGARDSDDKVYVTSIHARPAPLELAPRHPCWRSVGGQRGRDHGNWWRRRRRQFVGPRRQRATSRRRSWRLFVSGRWPGDWVRSSVGGGSRARRARHATARATSPFRAHWMMA